jgi:hypothetical protein
MPVKDSGMWRNKSPMSKEYRKGGKLYMGGGGTEVGKEAKSYKEYVKKMFGGGILGDKITGINTFSPPSPRPAPRSPRLSRPPGAGMRHGNRNR